MPSGDVIVAGQRKNRSELQTRLRGCECGDKSRKAPVRDDEGIVGASPLGELQRFDCVARCIAAVRRQRKTSTNAANRGLCFDVNRCALRLGGQRLSPFEVSYAEMCQSASSEKVPVYASVWHK